MPTNEINKMPQTADSVNSVGDLDFNRAVELLQADYPGLDREYTIELLRDEFPEIGRSKLTRAEQQAREDARLKKVPWPETHYEEKYKAKNVKPRSSKRPPQIKKNPYPAPMSFETFQRSVFQGHDVEKHPRPEPYQKHESYVAPTNKMDGLSMTHHDFVEQPLHDVVFMKSSDKNYVPNDAKFSSNTTNKDFFKNWVPERKLVYGELPSFAQSVLFPSRTKFPQTETQMSFPGAYAAKPEMVKMKEGNLKVNEGDHDHLTVHKDTYRGYEPIPRTKMIINQPTDPDHRRGKFYGVTQSMDDYSKKSVPKNRRSEPARETINLKFDRRPRFETEQRLIYQGHDTTKHPVAKPFKRDPEMFTLPTDKFETNTTNTLCYTPKDLEAANVVRAQAPQRGVWNENIKFSDSTTNKEFFRKHDIQRRQKYGDFHETYKGVVRPVEGLSSITQTRAIHTPKKGEIPASFKPVSKPIESAGEQDFNTVHKLTYVPHPSRPSKALLRAMLKQSIQKRKMNSNKVVFDNSNGRVGVTVK